MSELEQLLTRVQMCPMSGCWLWSGSVKRRGYGSHAFRGKRSVLAHRASWVIHNGPIEGDMYVCHRCDVPACVNPAHLFLGTPAQNQADMVRKDRQLKGEDQPQSKLTEDKVRAIRALYADGLSQRKLAAKFGVSATVIHAAVNRRTWKHV